MARHRPKPNPVMLLYSSMSAFILLSLLTRSVSSTDDCTSGVLQLISPKSNDKYDACITPDVDRNSIKAVCGAAFKVTVTNGVISMVPLVIRTLNYTGPGPDFGPLPTFNCKDHNASGLFYPSRRTKASVMLFDNYGGPLSNLTRTSPSQVALSVGRTYSYMESPFPCTYFYNVISGCVLGAKPASPTPPPCPPGHALNVGRYGIKYCAPCPAGTFTKGGPGATCTPCPVGTVAGRRGSAACRPCNGVDEIVGTSKAGAAYCAYCFAVDSNKWTDGKTKCERCPANSSVSQSNVSQCVRCYAGKKCCTVNWDKNCPKCTSGDKPKAYTSIFALESATPASCLTSSYARCAPKINITIDGTCQISVDNLEYDNRPEYASGLSCPWRVSLPIRGPVAQATVDLAQLGPSMALSLPAGKVTSAASPYLDITVPSAKCTLRYRALTKPAAAILGAAPKPAPAATCPAGKYIDTSTDTKPGPCLPCPPGTYSTKAGTTGACTRCPAGTYANQYSSTRCTKCPPGRISKLGAASCTHCEGRDQYANADGRSCSRCPKYTSSYYRGASTCLANVWGSICCAAGLCNAQPKCGKELTADNTSASRIAVGTFQSLFRMKSASLSSPTCKNATHLACMPIGSKLLVGLATGGLSVSLDPLPPNTCTPDMYVYGGVLGTNRALLMGGGLPSRDNIAYEMLSNPADRTLKMYLSTKTGYFDSDFVDPTPAIRKECYVTFELLDGFFLDLKPAAAKTCPPATKAVTFPSGQSYCASCGLGRFRKTTGACQACPKGTYQPFMASTSCKPCPAGYYCQEEAHNPSPCWQGMYGTKPRAPECEFCPAGTYTGFAASTKCVKCPRGTISQSGSSACGVPWVAKF